MSKYSLSKTKRSSRTMMSLLTKMKLAYSNRPRYQKAAITISFIYLLFILTLGLLVPLIASKQLPKILKEQLGRQVSLEDIKINPFTFETSLHGFSIAEKDSTTDFISIETLSVDFLFWQSLFNLNVTLDYLTIEGSQWAVTRLNTPSNQFNFSDILDTLAANNNSSEPTESDNQATPIALHLNRFELNKARVNFDDKVTQSSLTYPNITINGQLIKTDALLANSVDANKISLSITDDKKGVLALNTQFQLSPILANGQVTLTQITLPQYWSFIDSMFDVSLTSANLNVSTDFAISEPVSDQLEANVDSSELPVNIELTNTDIALDNIVTKDTERNVATISLLALEGLSASSKDKLIDIPLLTTNNADFWLTVAPKRINLVELFTPKQQQAVNTQSKDNAPDYQATANNLKSHDNNNSAQQWLVTLHQFKLNDYQFELTESVANKTSNFWKISNINLSTGVIKSDLSVPIDYQLDLSINDQSQFASQGQIDANLMSIEADIDYQNMDLTKLQPYIAPFMNITLEDGLFNTKGHVSANNQQKLIFKGQASVLDLKIKDNVLKQPLLNWDAMKINQLTFDNLARSLLIDEIQFNQLFSRLVIAEDRSTNIADLIVQPASKGVEEIDQSDTASKEAPIDVELSSTGSTEPAFAISINRIGLKESSAFFADNSLTPNFASGIEQLTGEITQISTNPQTRASVNLEGKIDKYAPVTLKGDVNPLLANPYLDLNLAFNKVELTSINPYSGTYAGYYIDKGQLSLALNYKLENNQLVGSNHLVVDQLQLGKPSNSSLATSLPITLAIALLQDRHGVIDLGVNVDGDLDSPSFSFGSIIMTAITNVITKAITAPFSLLAGLVDSDEEMDKVSFEYGQAIIDANQQSTLSKLASALNDRPLLMLNIKGSVDLVNDQQALQQQQLHSKLAALAKLDISELPANLSASQFPTQGELVTALMNLYQNETQQDPQLIKQQIQAETPEITAEELATRWHIALYNLTLNQQNVTESALGQLAQQRAKAVKTYLVEQALIDPSRVFILESRVHMEESEAQAILTLEAN